MKSRTPARVHMLTSCICVLTSLPGDGETEYRDILYPEYINTYDVCFQHFIGSMSDPWEILGLAHFLEHMLFLGTKKVSLYSASITV